MSAYKIEKNIPMPEEKRTKYPWHDMEVGDSFFCPSDDDFKTSRTLTAAAYRHNIKHRNGKAKFTVKKVDGGFRVWRVK